MSAYHWVVHDAAGAEIRTSEPFDSKEQAEAWMGQEWKSLLDAGGESVSLLHDGAVLYQMGLEEE
ncbi:MAG: hypothetical protein M3526_04185 [Actinomycetota bacterium]|nr:hypothetical protein [Actinomycetota bacterium]